MDSKRKAESIGRILITATQLDTVSGEHIKLQNILGEKIYYQKGGKWYYEVQKLNKKTFLELTEIADKIEKSV